MLLEDTDCLRHESLEGRGTPFIDRRLARPHAEAARIGPVRLAIRSVSSAPRNKIPTRRLVAVWAFPRQRFAGVWQSLISA